MKEYFYKILWYALVTSVAATLTYLIVDLISINLVMELICRSVFCITVPNMILLFFYQKEKEFVESVKFMKILLKHKLRK